jgi:hypothetical protein
MATAIPTQAQYEAREARMLDAQLRQIEAQSLADRREARKGWLQRLRDPQWVAGNLAMMLDGSYGFGAHKHCETILANSRPKAARIMLCTLLAALDCNCPARFATDAWKALSDAEKAALDAALTKTIEEHQKGGE